MEPASNAPDGSVDRTSVNRAGRSVGYKLGFSFAISLAFAGTGLAVVALGLEETDAANVRVHEALDRARTAVELELVLHRLLMPLNSFLLRGKVEEAASFEVEWRELAAARDRARGLETELHSHEGDLQALESYGREILAIEAPVGSLRGAVLLEEMTRLTYEVSRDFGTRQHLLRVEAQQSVATGQEVRARLVRALSFSAAFAGLGTLLAGLILFRTVRRPLRALLEGVRRVSTGEASVVVDTHSTDEFADLAQAFNDMVLELEDARERAVRAEKLAAVGHLALAIRHEVANPVQGIVGAVDLLVSAQSETDPTRPVLEAVRTEARRLGDVMGRLNDATDLLAEGAELARCAAEAAPNDVSDPPRRHVPLYWETTPSKARIATVVFGSVATLGVALALALRFFPSAPVPELAPPIAARRSTPPTVARGAAPVEDHGAVASAKSPPPSAEHEETLPSARTLKRRMELRADRAPPNRAPTQRAPRSSLATPAVAPSVEPAVTIEALAEPRRAPPVIESPPSAPTDAALASPDKHESAQKPLNPPPEAPQARITDSAATLSAITSQLRWVEACHRRARMESPGLSGRLIVRVVLDADGGVNHADLVSSTLGHLRAEECILESIRRWRFPSPAGGASVSFKIPITLD
ncbi:MAG: TonB family protein [Deltaproteobacteria bacterium]|nr:TonB family protein [Deltaproteobacteria bacterium]